MLPGGSSWQTEELAIGRMIDITRRELGMSKGNQLVGTGWGIGADGVVSLAKRQVKDIAALLLVDCMETGWRECLDGMKCPVLAVGTTDWDCLSAATAIRKLSERGTLTGLVAMPGVGIESAYGSPRVALWARAVVEVPVLGRVLQDHRSIQEAEARIEVESWSDTVPRTVEVISLAYRSGTWTWCVRSECGEAGGFMSDDDGFMLLLYAAKCLMEAGVGAEEGTLNTKEDVGIRLHGKKASVSMRLGTGGGSWEFRRVLGAGPEDGERTRGIGRAVCELQRRLASLLLSRPCPPVPR
jgi:hypothetical protein